MTITEVIIKDDNFEYVLKKTPGHDECVKCAFYKSQKETWGNGCIYASALCEEGYYKKKRIIQNHESKK